MNLLLRRRYAALFVVGLAMLSTDLCLAHVRLPQVFGSGMVLQRDRPIPVWGWADPGEEIRVHLGKGTDVSATTRADGEGRWRVDLPAMKAGGPYRMTVSGHESVKLDDILIGEVWLCSGQSNMQWSFNSKVTDGDAEVAAADYPRIRLLTVPRRPAGSPMDDIEASWSVCTPESVKTFSAVGYFFGSHLHRQLGVPIGLINSSWGGTRIEPWAPPRGFASVPALKDVVEKIDAANANHTTATAAALPALESWLAATKTAQAEGKSIPPAPALPRHALNSNREPTGLYNGMIHALVPFALRGAIWYQGESNVGEGMRYYHLKRALVQGWREIWGQGDFPFYFVQLAPFSRYKDGGLPGIWEAQKAALAIPNVGMIVTTDLVDDINDIHPRNKKDVGKRLARWALAETYGQTGGTYSGPLYHHHEIKAGAVRLHFDHVADGLGSRDGQALDHFQIAGTDQKFVDARAVIDGNTVVVSSTEVARPQAVRFAWQRTAMPNLINSAGLPASPFRTDRW
jgi:sialate O-acetylesterase